MSGDTRIPYVEVSSGGQPNEHVLSRVIQAVMSGNLLYFLIIYNFDRFELSLGAVAYRVEYNGENVWTSVLMISFLALALGTAVRHHRSLVGFFAHLAFAIVFVPLCAVYTTASGDFGFVIAGLIALVMAYLLFGRTRFIPKNKKGQFDDLAVKLFTAIALVALYIVYKNGDLSIRFLDFRDVYGLREDAAYGEAAQAGRLMSIAAYVCAPYLVVYGAMHRKWLYLGFGLFISYILYNAYGYKLFLFAGPMACLLYIYMRMRYSFIIVYVPIFLLAISSLLFATKIGEDVSYVLDEIFIRRYFYVPGYVSYAWYDFFAENPKVYWSNLPILRELVRYPYSAAHANLVSLAQFGYFSNPSTGMFGNGFANFGHAGVVLFTLFVYGFLALVDTLAIRQNSAYLALGAATPATIFMEADPLVTLLSFGFGVVVAVVVALDILRQRSRDVEPRTSAMERDNPRSSRPSASPKTGNR